MRALLELPMRALRVLWSFVNPSRTAGRVPLGRFTIVVAMIVALIFVGYTMSKKSIRFPFSGKPYEIEVAFSDAKGLDALDEPAAAVAGTPLGRVTDVRLEGGQAVAKLTFDPDVRGKIFADATATMRPASAIQNLSVNVDPGTESRGPLEDGERIEASRTEGYVSVHELTRLLDTDTQAYVQILIGQAQRALRNREGELKGALRRLGRLTDDAIPVSRALADRRRLLTRLVGDLDTIFRVTGERGLQLANALDAANHTLAVTAGREVELTAVTRELAPTLVEAQRSLAATRRVAEPLVPALDLLLPTAPAFTRGLRSLRLSLPLGRRFFDTLDVVTRDGRDPLRLLVRATRGLKSSARSKIKPVRGFLKLNKILKRYRTGIAQTADTLSGALSEQDRGGPYTQVDFLKFEAAKPENLGYAAAAANRHGSHSKLEVDLSKALERTCRRGIAYSCVARFQIPGLPPDLVSAAKRGAR